MTLLDRLRDDLGDRYDIERELGGGGMSAVVLAVERALDRRVVIKVLPPDLAQSVSVERFRQEVATLATLQHPQLVPLYASGQAGELLYYVMPYVAGESLRARLEREGRLPPAEVVRLLAPLARALAYAHREGIVHRDIKPENILLAHGEPVLADFGIAKVLRDGVAHGSLTSAGMSVGTATYMAPEQVVADPTIDGRADVYSLAAVGYELVAGVPPFRGTPQQVMSAHVVTPVPPLEAAVPGVPPALARAIHAGLAKEVAERPTAAEFAAALEGTAAPGPFVAPASSRRAPVWIAAAALAGAVLAGATLWSRRAAAPTAPAASPGAATAARPGIAVLPFERIGDAADAYLAAGVTDELMTQLADVPALRVASRTTVRAYADSALPPAALGRRLDVRALVEGTVQRAGNRLRVAARLVDAAEGTTLWADRYERDLADLFAVQREIAAEVVRALAPRLGLGAPAPSARDAGTRDPAAYDLDLRGRYALDQRGLPGLREAVARFEAALARDPRFARAAAGIAEALALEPTYGGARYAALEPRIRDAAARALALDSTLAAPAAALGLLAKGLGRWSEAERAFARALARDPALAAAHQNLGELRFTTGRLAEAARDLGEAARLEPASAAIGSEFAFALLLTGQVDSARRVVDRALARDPAFGFAHFTRAVVLERQGDLAGARAAMHMAGERLPLPFFTGATVRLARRAGDSTAIAAGLRALAGTAGQPGSALARAVAGLDAAPPDEIVALLARADAEGDPLLAMLPLRWWWFDAVRDRPAFAAFAARRGLPPAAIRPAP